MNRTDLKLILNKAQKSFIKSIKKIKVKAAEKNILLFCGFEKKGWVFFKDFIKLF